MQFDKINNKPHQFESGSNWWGRFCTAARDKKQRHHAGWYIILPWVRRIHPSLLQMQP